MAIAVDTYSHSTTSGSDTTLQWSHTCTGSDLTIVVAAVWEDNSATDPNEIITCTYNSVSLTHLVTAQNTSSSYWSVELWYLDDPATGANNVDLEVSEAMGPGRGFYGYAISLTGASNGSGSNTGSAVGSGTGTSCTFTTDAATSLIIGAVCHNVGSTTWTENDGETSLYEESPVGTSAWFGYKSATGGSDTLDLTASASNQYAVAAIEILAAAAGGGRTTKNTDSHPLGIGTAISWRVPGI